MCDKHPWKDEDRLREKYCVEGLNMNEIAEEWGTTRSKVRYWKRKFDIQRPYKDEEWLRGKYIGEKRSMYDIAELCGVDGETIRHWVKKFNIETRSNAGYVEDEPWRDKKELERLYHEEGMSGGDIAEKFDCHPKAVYYWMEEHGIERRDRDYVKPRNFHNKELLEQLYLKEKMSTAEIADKLDCSSYAVQSWLHKHDIPTRGRHPYFSTTIHGYELVSHKQDYEKTRVRLHRLLAVACGKMTPEQFANDDWVVHHKNNISWDNRPSNLEVMTLSEHSRLHQTNYVPAED